MSAGRGSMRDPNQYVVRLFSQIGLGRRVAQDVERWFARCPGPVKVQIESCNVTLKTDEAGVIEWDPTFAAIAQLRVNFQIPVTHFVFLLTKSPNEMNWYAADNPQHMRDGFGHAGDFDWVTTAPSSVICAHYIFKAILNALVSEAGREWQLLMHSEPRGCFYDFCPEKRQLNLKLRTADICGDCLSVFHSLGISDALLRQVISMMELQRKLALSTAHLREPDPSFRRWPFPVAITRHKAVQASNPLHRFMLLLDHFDSLVRYFYLVHEVTNNRIPSIEENPSLGWWVDQLGQSMRGERDFREVVRISQQEQIVMLRNEMRGHGWIFSNSESYLDEAKHLEQVLGRIESELEPFLERYRLVIPRQMSLQEGTYSIEGDDLTGSNVLYPQFHIKAVINPVQIGLVSQDEVFVTDSRMTWFRQMTPFILSRICPMCRHERILIIDGKNYIDVFVGHRVAISNTKAARTPTIDQP